MAPGTHVLRSRAGDPTYSRRRPEETVLYGIVQQELETFLARAQARERPVPRFVERELRAYLRCGILAHGFVRVHCDEAISTALDRVLPEVPIRQWVLSLPLADGNATWSDNPNDAADGVAEFELPDPDPDNDGITAWSVYVRALGTPGGTATMVPCFEENGERWCSTEDVIITRSNGQSSSST